MYKIPLSLSDRVMALSYTPMDIHCSLVLGVRNFPDFRIPKQASINAFYYIICLPTSALQGFFSQVHINTLPLPLVIQNVSNRKSTANVWIVQFYQTGDADGSHKHGWLLSPSVLPSLSVHPPNLPNSSNLIWFIQFVHPSHLPIPWIPGTFRSTGTSITNNPWWH